MTPPACVSSIVFAKPNILLLVHRVPFPPNRGDRVRSWQLVKWLAARSQLDLACLADEPVPGETRDKLTSVCRRVAIEPVGGLSRWANAACSLLAGRTATAGLFSSSRLRRTINEWSRDKKKYDAVVVFCSSMAPYLNSPGLGGVPAVVDFVDVDSQKWLDYAAKARGIKRTLFSLEGRRMQRLERSVCQRATSVIVVSRDEADLLRATSPEAPVRAIENGVDLEYFHADVNASDPSTESNEVVFVGALDYRANIDGVVWFCQHVWPQVRDRNPNAQLSLVGRRPAAAVGALDRLPGVSVVADVPDVRPYLSRAAVVVAPLRIARGIQNKVLEAAAMAKAIVASPQALTGLELRHDEHAICAPDPQAWVVALADLLASPDRRRRLGRNARSLVEQQYRWEARLAPLEGILAAAMARTDLPRTAKHHSKANLPADDPTSAPCVAALNDS
ncbi:MAG: TIGR03087 family PEP-CTERM/XrtA system glycosyltransferase [Pirellulales bacterium]